MSANTALCLCAHVHETATLDGTTSVFHRCRAKECGCNEFRPDAPAPSEAEGTGDVATLLDGLDQLLREPCDVMDRSNARTTVRQLRRALAPRPASPSAPGGGDDGLTHSRMPTPTATEERHDA